MSATLLALRQGRHSDPVRAAKVAKALGLLAQNPRHPGLQSHRSASLDDVLGAPVWESYVENRTPGAWRIWWFYGPNEGQITVIRIAQHPD